MKLIRENATKKTKSRAPYGARGLKRESARLRFQKRACRAPYGARGLKPLPMPAQSGDARRAPYGARGLKPKRTASCRWSSKPRPVRGAWVET